MPLQNRVTPFGEIVAVPERGTLMGNRGVLHEPDRRIVRDSHVRRWIACRLEFRGRHRCVMPPGRWTALFFLDEATAFAAGHRPCAECRHGDYVRFRQAWPHTSSSVDDVDRILHAERRAGPWRKRTFLSQLEALPTGAFVALDGAAWLVYDDSLVRWAPAGYSDHQPRFDGSVTVLTPPSLVDVFRNGYVPTIHPSANEPT